MPSFIYRAILATSGFRHSATIDKTLLNVTPTLHFYRYESNITCFREIQK